MNIPVTRIVEEITDREYSSYLDCGRDYRVVVPVTQTVEEVTELNIPSSTDCGRDRRDEQIPD